MASYLSVYGSFETVNLLRLKSKNRNEPTCLENKVCHSLRLMKQGDNFWVNLNHFRIKRHLFEAAGALMKICLSLKHHHNQI